jgi:sulfopropanediol 3-dehydrogenase
VGRLTHYIKQPVQDASRPDQGVADTVSRMLSEIERRGEGGVREYSRSLDHWDPRSFLVDEEQIAAAENAVPDDLKERIEFAQQQVRAFAQAQRATLKDLEIEPLPGVRLGHRHVPVERVGAYVPGGRYPMLASAFMTIITAKVAGVSEVIAAAPPRREGGMHPYMLYAARTSGADRIACIGGVQALAAMAFGIEGIPSVDMIVGPGNAYVAEAKRQLFGRVGIDILAGPTEIVVIADETASAELVATDLLGQAEHGPDSPAGLIALSQDLAEAVLAEVDQLLPGWPTADVSAEAWRNRGWIAVVESDAEAVELANECAPEHLEVQVEASKEDWYLEQLSSYGSLFLGEEATVAYGDKGIGTNHVLPTAGAARYTGGLWVGKYLKTLTYQRLSAEGTGQIAPTIAAISHAERFAGHARTAELRLERMGSSMPSKATSSAKQADQSREGSRK